jgi:thioesterase domain-containing protein/acyl carrier protein
MLAGLDPGVRFHSLRAVRIGSEPLYAFDIERLRAHVGPDCRVVTGYGATEASGIAEFVLPATLPPGRIPAGYALEDVEIAVHDDDGRAVVTGEAGEVIVRSTYLSSGYWRRPDLTRAVFQTDPHDARVGCYRTGDIGRLRPDGCLELVGRRDDQVKIRGYRVNPGEIELALVEHSAIREAVVAETGEARLVAYVVPRASPAPPPALLRRHLETRLPGYMIPSAFAAMDALPLTASGKVDRRALPEPPKPESVREGPFVAPRTPTEHQLAAMWEELFGVTRIGASDDFFDLGGDSLRAAALVASIEDTFARVLAPAVLLKAPKVADLAKAITEDQPLDEPITELRATGSETPIFFLHNDDGRGLYTHALARSLDAGRPFYAVHRDAFDSRSPALTVEALAAYGTQALRAVRPRGPYVIGGHCNGGAIALEMARQLRESGEEVELVVMVDTRAPSRRVRMRRRLSSVLSLRRRPMGLCARICWELGWRVRYYRERAALFGKAGLRAQLEFIRRKLQSRNAEPSDEARGGWRFHVPAPTLDSWRAQSRAVKRYVPPPYPGRVALFLAKEFPAPEPDLGWSALLPRLEVVIVPGDHHTCITRHVAAFAARLDELLRRTEAMAE